MDFHSSQCRSYVFNCMSHYDDFINQSKLNKKMSDSDRKHISKFQFYDLLLLHVQPFVSEYRCSSRLRAGRG